MEKEAYLYFYNLPLVAKISLILYRPERTQLDCTIRK